MENKMLLTLLKFNQFMVTGISAGFTNYIPFVKIFCITMVFGLLVSRRMSNWIGLKFIPVINSCAFALFFNFLVIVIHPSQGVLSSRSFDFGGMLNSYYLRYCSITGKGLFYTLFINNDWLLLLKISLLLIMPFCLLFLSILACIFILRNGVYFNIGMAAFLFVLGIYFCIYYLGAARLATFELIEFLSYVNNVNSFFSIDFYKRIERSSVFMMLLTVNLYFLSELTNILTDKNLKLKQFLENYHKSFLSITAKNKFKVLTIGALSYCLISGFINSGIINTVITLITLLAVEIDMLFLTLKRLPIEMFSRAGKDVAPAVSNSLPSTTSKSVLLWSSAGIPLKKPIVNIPFNSGRPSIPLQKTFLSPVASPLSGISDRATFQSEILAQIQEDSRVKSLTIEFSDKQVKQIKVEYNTESERNGWRKVPFNLIVYGIIPCVIVGVLWDQTTLEQRKAIYAASYNVAIKLVEKDSKKASDILDE